MFPGACSFWPLRILLLIPDNYQMMFCNGEREDSSTRDLDPANFYFSLFSDNQ